MKRIYCEKEKEIIEALRCGALDTELEEHARVCGICSDTVAVSGFLQAERTAEAVLPDADFLWWKGQLAGEQMAVERATRSIALVRRISYLCSGGVAVWVILSPGYVRSIVNAFPRSEVWSASVLGESALLIGVGALVFGLVGSLYLAQVKE